MKPCFKALKNIFLAVLCFSFVSGCASLQSAKNAPQAEGDAAEVVALPTLDLPDIELTVPVLNRYLLANIAIQRGRYGVALRLYRDLALETRDPRLAERATRVALFARAPDVALETGQLWLELDPENFDARQIMTALLVNGGDLDGALTLLEGLLVEREGDDHERYKLILRLLGREKNGGARVLMERYLERHPDDVAGLYAHAQLALRDGKTDASIASIDRLLLVKSDWIPAVVLRTRILEAMDRDEDALSYLQAAIERNDKESQLRIEYGRILVDGGQFDAALDQYDKVLKQEPHNGVILFAASLTALRVENVAVAKVYLTRLNEMGERLDDSSFYLGRIEEEAGNYTQAIEWYRQVNRGPSYLDAQVRFAFLTAKQGDVDAARAHLGTVRARGADNRLKLFIAEGEILRELKLYDDALAVYDHAIKELPGRTELLYARAMMAEKLDRLDLLENDLLAILEHEPDHVEALNSLGYTLADRTNRYEEALVYVKRALALRPDAFHIMDSYGWVQYRLGNLDEALKYLRQAIALNYDAEIAAHLGEVLWVMGDRSGANNVWDEAMKRSPENNILLDAIGRLRE